MSVRAVIVALTPAAGLLRALQGSWARWALTTAGAQLARSEASPVHVSCCRASFARPRKAPIVLDLTCEAMEGVPR